VNRRDLYAAVDSYVEVRVSRAEAEVARLRSEMADLRRRAEAAEAQLAVEGRR
jgi:hypothetical protein